MVDKSCGDRDGGDGEFGREGLTLVPRFEVCNRYISSPTTGPRVHDHWTRYTGPRNAQRIALIPYLESAPFTLETKRIVFCANRRGILKFVNLTEF